MESESDKLTLDSRDALRLAALLGYSFSLPVLLEAGVAAEHLDALFDQGMLIEESSSRARFASENLLESVQENTPWSQKRRWSGQLAEILEKQRGNEESIANLYLASQDYAKARGFFVRAAERNCVGNHYRKALQLLNEAFEIWPPDEDRPNRQRVLREMARCATNTGATDFAKLAWEELLEMAEEADDVSLLIDANGQLAELAAKRTDRLEIKHRLKRAAELSSQGTDFELEARQWRSLAQFFVDNVRLREGIEACNKGIGAADKAANFGLKSELIALSGLAHAMSGNARVAHNLIEDAIQIALKHQLPDKLEIAYRRKANVNEYSCNYEAYLKLELESLERCKLQGASGNEQACLCCLSYAFFRLGKWKQANEAIREAVDEHKIDGELLAVATAVKGCISAFKGERRQAENSLNAAHRLIGQYGGVVLEFHAYWAMGLMADLDGVIDTANKAYSELIALWRDTEDRKDGVPGLLAASMFYTDQNNPQMLSECIDILNTISAANKTQETQAASNAALAESAWLRGNIKAAIDLCSKALLGYETQGLPIEQVMVGRRLGKMHASKDDLKAADAAWTKASEIARSLGMRPLLNALENDRGSVGLEIVKSQQASAAGLTKRQVEVLRLIAEGCTNKEAAAKLKISPRTVEMHTASLLERLNCRGRAEATKKAAEMGLV